MTSTTIPQLPAASRPPDPHDPTLRTEPDVHPGSGPRRQRSRFPGRAAARSAGPDGPVAGAADSPAQVRWSGQDESLRELVRDHATAAGMALVDSSAGPCACVVVEGASLVRGDSDGAGSRSPLIVVTAEVDIPASLWQHALAAGALAVIPLPDGSEQLLSQFSELARPRGASTVLAVAGGCGGAGASSFAARLAGAARTHGPVVLVDADPLGGGLDLLVETSPTSGIGWQEATGLGPDDGEALREGLPRVDDVHLLISGDHAGPDPQTLSRVLSALSPLGGTVVVDLGAGLVPVAAEHADHLFMVVPSTDHAVRASARRLRAWRPPEMLAQAVVRRRGPLTPAEVAHDLDLPLAASFRDSPRSTVPLLDARRRGADRAARRLLTGLAAGRAS
ncbi:hypothetical protein ACFQS2_05375 [Brachybacterium sp. GCM10030267]|uniref:hypothetical protein n=1 Tax=unclassified Brachybacterium TaxID=2623841 RepID=UPI003619FAB2